MISLTLTWLLCTQRTVRKIPPPKPPRLLPKMSPFYYFFIFFPGRLEFTVNFKWTLLLYIAEINRGMQEMPDHDQMD